jgi:hypothetical protein
MDLLQYNNNDNERIQMLKMPKIHYIDFKSDEQRHQDITVLKSLEVSGTSLACLIMICSLLDVTYREHNDKMASFAV